MLTIEGPLLIPLVVDLLEFGELPATEPVPVTIDLVDPGIALVTVVLLVKDLVKVDVAAPEVEVGTETGLDAVDTVPLLTEV